MDQRSSWFHANWKTNWLVAVGREERRRFSRSSSSPSSSPSLVAFSEYRIHFLLPVLTQKPHQTKIRITLERDGKTSELQVEEGDNILQVRGVLLFFFYQV